MVEPLLCRLNILFNRFDENYDHKDKISQNYKGVATL
jgi:hypothetical protein